LRDTGPRRHDRAIRVAVDIHPPEGTTARARAHDGNEYPAFVGVLDTVRDRIFQPIPLDNVLRHVEAHGGGCDVRGRVEGIAGGIGLLRIVGIPLRTMGRRRGRNVLERVQIGQPIRGIVRDRAVHAGHVRRGDATEEDDGRWGDTLRVRFE
jgi:hypothetical protein